MISAIVLASGFSKRLKKDKLLTLLDGEPLIERVLKEVLLSKVDETILVYREDEIKKIGERHNVMCVLNRNAERGMSESLKLGVKASSDDTDAYIFFVGDQVFLTHEVINEIIACHRVDGSDIVIPLCKGEKTNPVCFPSSYKDQLLSLEGDAGGRQIIQKQKDNLKFLEISSENLCLDLDTEDDLKKIKSLVASENGWV